MKNITFTDITPGQSILKDYYPVPASKNIPEWYKKSSSYIDNKKEVVNGQNQSTVKRCVPVFDAMTMGYIIPTYVDVYVNKVNNQQFFNWPSLEPINFHSAKQIDNHPFYNEDGNVPKWINPWSIKTPPGYSSIIIPPMHNPNKFFTILEGVVDTDSYGVPINFPFFMNDPDFEGLIPAGTPMAQIIPFRREEWKMKIGGESNVNNSNNDIIRLKSKWFDSYRKYFWSRKSFK